MEKSFQHTLVTGIAPVFYKSSKTDSKSKIIRSCLGALQKYGILINSVILHIITLLIYSTMGAILRNTMFHFNIKTSYDTYSDISEDHSNGTMKLNEVERNPIIPSYLNVIIFEQPLHDFPVKFVEFYIICTMFYVVFTAIYYRGFHPWKNIIWGKKSNKNIQEVQMESIPQQHDDEDMGCAEITHL